MDHYSSPLSASASVISRFRLTIPPVVRESMQLQVGDSLVFVRGENGFWKLIRVPADSQKNQRADRETRAGER